MEQKIFNVLERAFRELLSVTDQKFEIERKCLYGGNKKKLCSEDCQVCFMKSFSPSKRSVCWSVKNKKTPREVFRSSNDKYFFNCDKCNHEFESALNDITNRNRWCPFCGNNKLCGTHDCKICFEKSFISHERSKYWSMKNKKTPREVFRSSGQKYIFDCDKCNHEFESNLDNITNRNSWCPFCDNKQLCSCIDCKMCFEKSFISHERSKYWSVKNKKTPREVFRSSNDKYFFNCDKCNHEFKSALSNITNRNSWCPFCGSKQLCSCIDCKICFEKSFIAHERSVCWSVKNKKTPREVFRSSYQKYFFNCDKCNHEFKSALSSITNMNSWCPKCKNKTELKFLNHLIPLYPDIQQQVKFSWCINPHTSRQLPYDFYIPSLSLIIEVDGPQHFRQISNWTSPEEQKSRDMFKINKAILNGFTIIRILQEDIFYDRNNWEINLRKELDKCPQEPDLIMIGDDKAFHTHFKCDVEIVFIDDD